MKVKLLFDEKSGRVIGGHVMGGQQAPTWGIFFPPIQQGLQADDLSAVQYGTHPLLTGLPLVYQVMWAAGNAVKNKQREKGRFA